MRNRDVARLLVLGAVVTGLVACSGDNDGIAETAAEEVACPLMERLRAAGDTVASADLSDPVAFDQALDDAVADYLSTLDSLAEVVPEELQADLATLRSSVEQLRFDDAVAARAALDGWVGGRCGSSPTTEAG
ncbi:MAG: hypothetical protein M5T61_07300 [Acidimicrobiia bacterium]|nr:hypothetical protein [Acidimicrobiia bacterium]